MEMNKPVNGFLDVLKKRLGYVALAAFLIEASILSWSIKRRKIIQEKENHDRISLALTNYSLR